MSSTLFNETIFNYLFILVDNIYKQSIFTPYKQSIFIYLYGLSFFCCTYHPWLQKIIPIPLSADVCILTPVPKLRIHFGTRSQDVTRLDSEIYTTDRCGPGSLESMIGVGGPLTVLGRLYVGSSTGSYRLLTVVPVLVPVRTSTAPNIGPGSHPVV